MSLNTRYSKTHCNEVVSAVVDFVLRLNVSGGIYDNYYGATTMIENIILIVEVFVV